MSLNEAVSRAVDIIGLVAASKKPMSLAEICRETGIPKTSAFGILRTLVEKNVFELADENAKTFILGLGLYETALSALSSTDLLMAARPLLDELNALIGETILFAVEDSGEMVFLDMLEGASYLRATVKLGTRVSMHCSAIGKAVLAALPERTLLEFLGNAKLERQTEHTIVSRANLLKELAEIRSRGYSIDDEENFIDVRCVGAPVYSRSRKVIAGISITTHKSRVDDDQIAYYGTLVHNAAHKISRRMGFSEQEMYWNKEEFGTGPAAKTG